MRKPPQLAVKMPDLVLLREYPELQALGVDR
jgi:hypothetical protein